MIKSLYNWILFTLIISATLWATEVIAQNTTVFNFTGGMQTYTVPAGVTKIFVDALGARGGVNYYYSRPGFGGRVQCEMSVTPGQVLNIFVGEAGYGSCYSVTLGSTIVYPGGYNGGGSGYGYGGGGGGATDIRIGGTALSNRVLVAGGGGGAGYFATTVFYERGGDGGGTTAENGYGDGSTSSTKRGVGGNQTTGGAGGTYSTAGTAGTLGNGGNAGATGRGGGGGGGFYGGGGGSYGGGGGGSSYTNGTYCSNILHTQGGYVHKDGNGVVRITTMPTGAAVYKYTGGVQTYTVPSGVNFLSVDMEGGSGGANLHWPSYMYRSSPGFGGRTKCIIPVTPGQTLNIYVGGAGGNGTMSGATQVAGAGGYNGGGNGTNYSTYAAGGGGGATDIRIGGTALSNRVLVAGGGGGAGQYLTTTIGYSNGGHGGGLSGQNAIAGSTSTGTVGGGTQSAGGVGGFGGVDGSLGNGGSLSGTSNPSGGGGGGYYGGGSGGYGSTTYSAGGGGGSSYTAATASQVEHTQGYNFSGNGRVIIVPTGPTVTTSTSSLSFGYIGVGGTSSFQVFSMDGSLLTSGGPLTVNTTSSYFEFSFNNSTWFTTAQSYTYTGTGFTNGGIYVRFKPTAAIAYSGNITITGGGLSSAVNVAVSGNGGTTCSSTPSAGTAGVSPATGNASTAFTLSLTGASTGGGVTFQWQSSPDGSTWTNIPGANTASYVYSGLIGNTQFRCISTCPSFATATSATTSATYTMPSSGCTPTSRNSSSTYAVGNGSGSPVIVNGETTTITDASVYASGTGGSSWYYNNTSMSVDFLLGRNYSATMSNSGTCYTTGSIWIDFNDDGRFNNDNELVGGYAHLSAHPSLGYITCPTGRPNPTITIPGNARPGAHRMRVMGGYAGTSIQFPGVSPYYPIYPLMNACPNSFVAYADTRDYTAIVKAPSPVVTASPTSLAFGNATSVNTKSAPARYSVITGTDLLPQTGVLSVAAPSGFELSTDGISWTSSISMLYTGGNLPSTNLYVRFVPTSAASYSGNVSITGGGIATSVNIAVSGTGNAALCGGTPTAGSAAVSPSSGSSITTFTLSLSGASSNGGLFYQWQSSPDGSTWANEPAGIYSTYTFSGLNVTTQYRCLVWCGAGTPVASSPVTVTFAAATMASSSCQATFSQASASCSSYGMRFQFQPFNGEGGSSINDLTDCETTLAYLDLTSTYTCTVNAATTYNPVLYAGTGPVGNYCNSLSAMVWIDLNNNGTFETGELVGGFAPNTVFTVNTQLTGTMTVTIPPNVPTGQYRMRLMSVYSSPVYPNILPCGSFSYGGTRDYSIYINGGAAPCLGTPVAGIASAGPESACAAFKANIFNVGETTSPGITWAWESSASPSSGFSTISGATNSFYQTSNITTVGTMYYRAVVSCGANTTRTPAIPVTLNQAVDVSDFAMGGATNACSGSGSTVTVNSSSLGTATFTVTYNLSGANTSTGNTATLTMGAATGTFIIPAALLSTIGSTTVTVTNVSSGNCENNVTTGNTTSFDVGTNPNITNFTSPTATNVCAGINSATTVNSTTLGSGTYTVTYNLSGANSSSGNTATLTMGATNGTFDIDGSLLPSSGSTTVTIVAITNATGCSVNPGGSNTATFTVSEASAMFAITGGGSYCTGGTGVVIGIAGSTTGNTYQLYNGASTVGAAIAGTGAAISFGSQTTTGTYSVLATNTTSACAIPMTGFAVVNVTSSPIVYSISGSGSYCSGAVSTAPEIILSASDAGASYQLYVDAVAIGSLVTGTGGPVSFGLQTTSGTYTAIVNPGAGLGCQMLMSGSATVVINPLPTAYSVTGGGNYCTGGIGVPVGVSFGATGTIYDLKLGAATVTSAAGTNSALSFGNITTAGTYSVNATITATGCSNAMSGTVTVGTNPVPTVQTVTGGGNYCSGGTGVAVGLNPSQSGVSYQLFNGASTVGSAVAGTGSAISFGNQTASGVYSVMATMGTCTAAMSGSATVIANPTPTVFTVTGGGAYCNGTSGSTVGLNGSVAGTNYTLYNGGTAVSTVAGTGAAISFGSFTVAATTTYTVLATTTGTGCTAAMSGAAVVIPTTPPTIYSVTGGGNYCVGGTGAAVSLTGSQTGVNYQLYASGVPVGGPIGGTGGGLSFGTFTGAGIYTVLASSLTSPFCQSTQAGSATIAVNPLPNVYPVTGGGNYCQGSTGVTVGLGGSQSGITYSAYIGASLVTTVNGTGSPISFGVQTLSGTYTVYAVNAATTCANNMSGSATIGVNPLPTAFGVTGTGSYCAGGTGVAVGLGSSTAGVNYILYNGSTAVGTVAGTGSAISFGLMTSAGTYTVQGNNPSTTCTGPMAGNAVITINALPVQYTVTSSGTNYCAGGTGITIGLTGSTSGVDYQLYSGSTPIGAPVSGTGSAISFGAKTAAGVYTVVGTNTTTLCSRNMAGSATIVIDAVPTVFAVTGGGNFCTGSTGVNVSLSGSQSGVSYQLYNGAAAFGPSVSGTGSALSFGTITTAGNYTVMATNAATCNSPMSGAAAVVVNALPTAYTVTSSGTNYCAGTTGITIGLSNSASGVNYQLYNGSTAIGSPVAGTGSAISLGAQTAAGTYTVKGIDATTGCTKVMTGSATVSINPAPTAYAVTGGGNYCAGGTGVNIGLAGSNTGINYQLYNGSMAVGSSMSGTGAALDFGTYTTSGTYMVVATNGTTTCSSNMTGAATVVINSLPSTFTVTGGGNYCNGGAGLHVGLSGSTPGIAYQLYNGLTPVGSFVTGSGLALDFGVKTDAGTYTVLGYNPSTTCNIYMSGSTVININPLPTIHSVTGGGSYCNGGTGVNIGLSSSTSGTSYQLYNGSATAGAPVFGTGSAIDFGMFTGTGSYSVMATSVSTSCQNAMSGTASVSISPLPVVQTVTGGGTICQGSTGANVYLNNSTVGVNYQLYNGPAPMGAPMPGTGSAFSFGPQTSAGTYTVVATNATTTCMRNMAGAATIAVNPQPLAHVVTGGGSYCSGDLGVAVGLATSTSGISYQLYNGSATVGSPVLGTGGAITFGLQTANGNYTVVGMNTTTGCTKTMTGNATVSTNSLPAVYTLSGGGSYCNGGLGVAMILSGSNTGVSYQLYNGTTPVGSPVAGTGTVLSFGLQTGAGTYMVIASNNATSCTAYMSGTATVNVNALPTAYVVGGGGSYCAGGAGLDVNLDGSNTGISYQLYRGGVLAGSAVAGNGGPISFGAQMTAGTYSVLATNTATSCTNAMTGSAAVVVNALPTAYNVSGGGTMCNGATGLSVILSNSAFGIDYQLYNGSTAVGAAMGGNGAALDFGPQSAAGTYMVVAMDPSTTCTKNMNGTATLVVNPLPTAQTVTGGGSYCNGGTGVAVGLAGSQTGVSYQLMNGASATGAPVNGTGSTISFGMQTAGGNYTVEATNNTTGCTKTMTGSATVVVNALPNAYSVLSLGSSYCAGGEGVHIMLSNSDGGVDYTLMMGSTAIGASLAGTGGMIDFGAQTGAGIYTVMANNGTCSRTMTGSVGVVINPLPTAYNVTGGGGYCNGTAGAVINLAGSNTGVSYQLYDMSGAVGSPVAGTGGPITFGAHPAGTYMVKGMNIATTCVGDMSGSVTVVMNPLPGSYSVTGGGAYCAGGAGATVGLAGSSMGISYQLMNGSGSVGTPVAGTGAAISFGPQTTAGNYTVMAMNNTTTCTNNMGGSATVSINALPLAHAVTGGGNYCAGGTGMAVGLATSSTGVNYQLYKDGTPVTGALMSGTGSALAFGTYTTGGNYTIMGTSTSTGCSNTMTGSAAIVVNPLPMAYTVTGGGNYCMTPGATGVAVGLNNSEAGISYQLVKDGTTNMGAAVVSTGGALSFGMQTATGSYTVKAMNTATGCERDMAGSATVVANPAVSPAVSINTGVGNTVCLGVLTTFTASGTNGGALPTYQWKVNGSNVGLGLDNYAYVPSNGDVVSVTMTSSELCATPSTASASITMTVSAHETPVAKVNVFPNDSVCKGTTVTYNVTPEFGGTAPTYIWKKNGSIVGTGTSYATVPNDGDVITCQMTSNFPCRLEDVVTTDVHMVVETPTTPVVSIVANPGTSIAAGQSVTLAAVVSNGSGANLTYQWKVNGVIPSGNTTGITYTSNQFANGDDVTVEVTNHGLCSPATGAKTVTMAVAPLGVVSVSNNASDIRLLPNPNNGDFTIRGTTGIAGDQELNAEVTDMLGQVVFRSKVMSRNGSVNERIQISNTLANGMYILSLRSETETKTFHFVMQQ